MKRSFLNVERPLITAMICCKTPDECIEKIELSIAEGAEAIGVGLEWLSRQYRTKKELTRIFSVCGELPVYVTARRTGENKGLRDEDIEQILWRALESGATLIDVPGDMYGENFQYGLNIIPTDVYRQTLFIECIHNRGGEVIMSSRARGKLAVYEYEMIASDQLTRNADIVGIFNGNAGICDSAEMNKLACRLDEITKGNFLLELGGTEGKTVSSLGGCMFRCVQSHGEHDSPDMPLLRDVIALRDGE